MKTSSLVLTIAFLVAIPQQHLRSEDGVPSRAKVVSLESSKTQIATWQSRHQRNYGIKFGSRWHVSEDVSYDLKLRFDEFDPSQRQPLVPQSLQVNEEQLKNEQVYIVQFVTQPLQEYRDAIESLGGELHKYLANHAYLVRLSADEKEQLEALPYVRWIGVYQPAYKVDESLLPLLAQNPSNIKPIRLNIMVHQRGPDQKNLVAEKINALGGVVNLNHDEGYRLEATVNGIQLRQLLDMPEVFWVDPWSLPEDDMDLARAISGANFVESIAGFSGQGVRGEVMDGNLFDSHLDFQDTPPIFHGPRGGSDSHGTGTYGIMFATGTVNPDGRGMLPDAQGIFADYGFLSNRYLHTAQNRPVTLFWCVSVQ